MKSVFSDKKAVIILMGPALLLYVLAEIVPVLWSIGYTFFKGNPIVGFTFTGTSNFERLFTDPDVAQALVFTLVYGLIATLAQVVTGYFLALLYVFVLKNRSSLVRTLIFFPVVLPTVAVALMFQKIFQITPQSGLINSLIEVANGTPIDWFGDGGHALFVLLAMDLWRSMGFYAVILFTGLLDIPEEILEAARMDGATGFGLVRRIVLPLSLPVLFAAFIFSINGTLKVFDAIIALTNGGPGNATTPLTVLMYNTSFKYGDYGFGSTIAILLTIVCLIFTIFIFRSNRRDITES
jgi:multiple sugar transport system permease protein/raffinose/stachyose/melibiose transport system permease protein